MAERGDGRSGGGENGGAAGVAGPRNSRAGHGAFTGGRLDDDDLALHVRPLVIFVCVVAGGASGGE